MLRINDTTALTVREIEYSIRIRDKDKSFSELRDLLRSELTRFDENVRRNRPDAENPIRDFLRINIERSILIRENTRIYFLNYKEKEGSFLIEFTLLVITSYINFGPIRQSLDYLVKDTIADYFEEILERHIPVSITVQANDKEVVTIPASQPSEVQPLQRKYDPVTRVLAILALAISLCISGIFGYKMISGKVRKENAKLKEDYINLEIEKKISEAVKDQKFNITIYKAADTAGSNKKSDTASKKK